MKEIGALVRLLQRCAVRREALRPREAVHGEAARGSKVLLDRRVENVRDGPWHTTRHRRVVRRVAADLRPCPRAASSRELLPKHRPRLHHEGAPIPRSGKIADESLLALALGGRSRVIF